MDLSSIDTVLLEDVLEHIHNYFVRETYTGDIDITDGTLPSDITSGMLNGQWYRIQGSYLNDGVYNHPAESLEDESFEGSISLLAIPKPLLQLVLDIQDWIDANKTAESKALESPYTSESFGGYSYTIRGDLTSQNESGGLTGWKARFASDLNKYRKMY